LPLFLSYIDFMHKLSPEAQTQVDELEAMAIKLAEKIHAAEKLVCDGKDQLSEIRKQIKVVIDSDRPTK
jgi:hypothetical protein